MFIYPFRRRIVQSSVWYCGFGWINPIEIDFLRIKLRNASTEVFFYGTFRCSSATDSLAETTYFCQFHSSINVIFFLFYDCGGQWMLKILTDISPAVLLFGYIILSYITSIIFRVFDNFDFTTWNIFWNLCVRPCNPKCAISFG